MMPHMCRMVPLQPACLRVFTSQRLDRPSGLTVCWLCLSQADGVAMRQAIAAGTVTLTFNYLPSYGTVPNPSGGTISTFRSALHTHLRLTICNYISEKSLLTCRAWLVVVKLPSEGHTMPRCDTSPPSLVPTSASVT